MTTRTPTCPRYLYEFVCLGPELHCIPQGPVQVEYTRGSHIVAVETKNEIYKVGYTGENIVPSVRSEHGLILISDLDFGDEIDTRISEKEYVFMLGETININQHTSSTQFPLAHLSDTQFKILMCCHQCDI